MPQQRIVIIGGGFAGVACAKTYTAPPSTTIMSAGMSVNLCTGAIGDVGSGEEDVGDYDEPRTVDACGGFGFIVRSSVFEDCAGLDEDYNPYGWEDVDFCLRARSKGHLCHYVPTAVLHHKGGKIGRGHVPLYEKCKVRHYFRLLWRHANWLQKCSCSVLVPLKAFGVMIRLLARGEGSIALAQLTGACEMLLGAIAGSGTRR